MAYRIHTNKYLITAVIAITSMLFIVSSSGNSIHILAEAGILIFLAISLITHRKKTKQLELERERLQLVVQSTHVGVWDWNPQTNHVYFDKGWCDMLGIDSSTVQHDLDTWQSRVHPDELADCFKEIQAHMQCKTTVYEKVHRMKHKDGHWVHILGRGKINQWDKAGNPIRFTGTNTDITSLQLAEHELNKVTRKFELLFESSPLGLVYCEMDGTLNDANQAYLDIIGYTKAEAKELTYWDVTPLKYQVQEAEQLEAMAKTGKYGPYEKQYVTKSGELVPVLLNGTVVEDDNGTQSIWSIVENLSETKKIEKELEEERQRALHSSRLAAVGEMSGGIAHEINNPLSIIMGFASNLKISLQNGEVEKEIILEKLNKIETTGLRIERIVKGLLKFSRGDQKNSQAENVQANEVITLALDLCQEKFKSRGVQLDIQAPSINIHCDKTQISQVILNLLNNSFDSIKNLDEKWINVSIKPEKNNVSIRVTDSGSELSSVVINKLFLPFFTTKKIGHGTGLGLSISKGIIESNDGTLIYSPINGKTSFLITLPAAVNTKDSQSA